MSLVNQNLPVYSLVHLRMQQPAIPRRPVHPLIGLIMMISFFFLGQVIGGVVGVAFSLPFLSGSPFEVMAQIQQILSNNYAAPNAWTVLMIVQACSSFGGFILGAWAYLFFIEGRRLSSLNTNPDVRVLPLAVIVLLGISFIIFNEWVYQWNRNWDLPNWLSGFEDWSRNQQKKLGEMTRFLTNFNSFGRLLVAMFVIAVLPAIGEELTFRGVIQPIIGRWSGNVHVAVWVTGFIFSFIHFQLDGFVPRLLLGVVFGYLYLWSGNIWYPIWAHFVNNGVTVLGLYLSKAQQSTIDLDNTEWISSNQALISVLISGLLLWYLKHLFNRRGQNL